MKLLKAVVPLLITTALVYLLHQSWGTVPPLGKLFSPFHGFLQNTTTAGELSSEELQIEGLYEPVTIHWDNNKVPHIFAQNDHDLYLAQGYTIASDRLWQMEFYTLVAAGRLTEVVGERALAYDQYNRRSGMAYAAQQIAEKLQSDSLSNSILQAYSDGVNAYISSVSEKELGVEYKILGYKPSSWSPYKTILMLMNMRNTLSGRSYDHRLTQVAQKHGMEVIDELFPLYPPFENPIIPEGTSWNFEPLEVPSVPSVEMAAPENLAQNLPMPNPNIGSNNWAVHGAKSATGLPILSNDPHLGLSLPSIWYQIQLHAPNMNVYGSSLPGVPGVTIGFNKDIAWGVTNVGSDLLDYYKIKFNNSKTAYFHDGSWKPLKKRIETYKMKTGEVVVDTILMTHHGPVIYENQSDANYSQATPAGYAMKWIAQETEGSDLLTFYYLNKAQNYDDYRRAISFYVSPAQNFIFASNQNDVAITANGKFPNKWKGQGRFLLDGTRKDHDWGPYIPMEHNPTVKNPERGFVSSANQFSADPSYPYYLDWTFADPYRGTRINERLERMSQATVDSLRNLQNDNYNMAAEWFLPLLLENLDEEVPMELRTWNYENNADAVGATIFEAWMEAFKRHTWEDEFSLDSNMLYPRESILLQLIKEQPESAWWDNKTTGEVESMRSIINSSFKAAIDSLTVRYGPMNKATWAWDNVKSTDVKHLVPAFESFSRMDIENGGGWRIVNATTGLTGPSWRMIVQLDKDWPQAYGVYPGGQSGNVGSAYYDNMLPTWTQGELSPLLFMKNEKETDERLKSSWTLKP